jgi:ribosomal protein S2
MIFSKINFTTNQLISADLFLGYHISNWNVRVNYFLLGRYKWTNIYNLNYTYFTIKRAVDVLIDLMTRKCSVWVVNENFSLFDRNEVLLTISKNFPELYFFNYKWYKGLLSNYKFVEAIEPHEFPHAIVVPNFSNNPFVVNEAAILNIPSFSLIDSSDNPINVFYCIPGNSKSIKSTIFFYLTVAKAAFYSRFFASSSFLFTFNKKARSLFKSKFSKSFYLSYSNFYLNYRLWASTSFSKKAFLLLLPIKKKFNLCVNELRRYTLVNFSALKYLNTLSLSVSNYLIHRFSVIKNFFISYRTILKILVI